ncbi:MAG: DUF2971 domain-containing protein [Fibrobacter sp.]|uniref:DUF2971 domain-containing protein n=1 Tax=Fibrobacter sp. TaxID=35828 RepID=UPI0025C55E80|nr:type I restriction enzyme HsdR N-terminal domain-containing protein [Fibrobacter sp.]MBQ3714302.1 DUF2971 domain-containing protein [Fibrobacter sp.]MBQ7081893.1 DUF2971 domain-containing protein [Fibrobacter sp.]
MLKIKVHDEYKIREDFFLELKKYMNQKKFSLEQDFKIQNKGRIDCCILDSRKKPYVFIEFKSLLNSSFARKSGKKQLLDYLEQVKEKPTFSILTDAKKRFYLYKTSQEENQFKKLSFNQLVTTLFPEAENLFVPKNYTIIKNLLDENKLNYPGLGKKDIVYENGAFSFVGEYKDFIANRFPSFNTNEKIVCRYLSLETAFKIIKNKSLKMNCIIGMNDSTEPDFIESMLYDGMDKIPGLQRLARNVYIMSCSSEKTIDNLTHWRLYGNDAKGVCLVFKVKKLKESRFKLGKVSYLDRDLPIESIEKINTFFEQILAKTKIPFAPYDFHSWAHFYKPLEYKIEKEIRLVFVNDGMKDKEWILSEQFNIVNSSIDVSLMEDDFPLELCQVILGSKCPEREVNKTQFEVLLEESGMEEVKVKLSTINSYR